jgi:hypothetical protein
LDAALVDMEAGAGGLEGSDGGGGEDDSSADGSGAGGGPVLVLVLPLGPPASTPPWGGPTATVIHRSGPLRRRAATLRAGRARTR